jgi:hypothetical protein
MKLWIARDFDGILRLFVDKPLLDSNDNIYYVDNDMEDDYISINKDSFPEVTFENSPQQVELKLVK